MKKRHTEVKITFPLRQTASETSLAEMCRKIGVSEPPFYAWRGKYVGMEVTVLRKVRGLREGDRELKQLVAGLIMDKQRLQDVLP